MFPIPAGFSLISVFIHILAGLFISREVTRFTAEPLEHERMMISLLEKGPKSLIQGLSNFFEHDPLLQNTFYVKILVHINTYITETRVSRNKTCP